MMTILAFSFSSTTSHWTLYIPVPGIANVVPYTQGNVFFRLALLLVGVI